MDRLATFIWIDALIRRVQIGGASAFVVQRGDAHRGDVLIKLARLDGTAAYLMRTPMSFEADSFDWLPKPCEWVSEADVDAYIMRRKTSDRDLWVVEIEDPKGRHFLTEKVNGEWVFPDGGPKS